MSFGLLIQIAVLGALGLLGLSVWLRGPQIKVNHYFGLLSLSIVSWGTGSMVVQTLNDETLVLWTGRLTFVAAAGIAAFFTLFALNFPRRASSGRYRSLAALLSSSTLVVALVFLSPFAVSGIAGETGARNVIPGPLYLLFVPYFLGWVGFSLVLLYRRYRSSQGLARTQLAYLFLGFYLSLAIGSFTNLFFPLVFSDTRLAQYGSFSATFFLVLTAYAIVRHRLMDIRLVVARSVAYFLLLTILGGAYAGSLFVLQSRFFGQEIGIEQIISSALLALFVALTFQPLRRVLEKLTDGIFYRERYDSNEFLHRLSTLISSTIILDNLTSKVLREIVRTLRVSGGAIVVLDRDHKLLIQNRDLLTKRLVLADIASLLHRHRITVFDDLPEGREKALLRTLEVAVAVPLESREGILGLILLGEKRSGDPCSSQDLEALEILSHELAVGIENARAYRQIEQFNETLRLRVERATRKLREANSHLRELDKAKDEFISLASHQLRTPLTAIKGYLSMVVQGDVGELNKRQREFLEESAGGADRMVDLIDDLLNISRMDAGRFILDSTPTDITEMVEEEVKALQPHAEEKGLTLIHHPPKRRLPLLVIDRTKTRQVILNFIDNAVYYTEKGRVEVFLERVGEAVEFRVVDTGIGVAPEDQPKLFAKFYRASNAQELRPDGTGLGLYLAKQVVEQQGGEVLFSSTPGKGSTFGFRFPLPKPSERTLGRTRLPSYHRRRSRHRTHA